MLGLDAAGKTTILYKLHIGEILSTVPTIGAVPGSLLCVHVPAVSCTCILQVKLTLHALLHLVCSAHKPVGH